MSHDKVKILLYDIETSYTVGAVWGLYEQNVAQVIREPYIISFAYKWLDEDKVHAKSLPEFKTYKKNHHDDKELVAELWQLFNEADIIIAHNGNAFDQKWTNARFIANGMTPPSPSKYIDTKLVAKRYFKFNSNSLNNLGTYLKLGQKLSTGGIDLWISCIERNDKKAWAKMVEYNKQDVVLLEQVYEVMKPWITNHPNVNALSDETRGCTACGSTRLHKRGFGMSNLSRHQRYQCRDCGKWNTGKPMSLGMEVRN